MFCTTSVWKSVSSKTAVAPASRFREFETLFPTPKRAKHWFKNLKISAESKKLSLLPNRRGLPTFSNSHSVFNLSYTWYKALPLWAGILPIGLPLQISQTLRHPDPPPTIIVCPSKARQFNSSPRSEKFRKNKNENTIIFVLFYKNNQSTLC